MNIFRRLLPACLAFFLSYPVMAGLPPRGAGYNGYGQLGDGTLANQATPAVASGHPLFTRVACGYGHSLGVTEDGALWAWGYNAAGQLGDGTLNGRQVPAANPMAGVLSGRSISKVAVDADSSLALLDNGTVAAWGYNLDGELGDGTTVNRPAPVLVSGITTAVWIATGRYHGLAVLADGSVRAWGYNGQGQLGDNTLVQRNSSVAVSGLSTATAVAGGDYHSLALLGDGTVCAWGYNASGQLGDGTATTRKTPVPVPGLTDVAQIASGAFHSVARKNDGTVWTWGANNQGELGLGDTAARSTPQQVPGLTNVVEIAAAGEHTIVRLADGTVRAFGDNSFGQLGDGTTTDRLSAVALPGIVPTSGLATGAFHSLFLLPAPPVVTLGIPTDVLTTTGTLHGTVTPWGAATTAQFEYGLTTNYGSTVPIVLSPDDGVLPQTFSPALTGLTPGKTYFYRITATNVGGTVSLSGSLATRSLFAQWALDQGLGVSAPEAGDPDADGLKNVVEYALGTNPLVRNQAVTTEIVGDRMTIHFQRSATATDASITVQGSDNLLSWTDLAASDHGGVTNALVTGITVLETGAGPLIDVEVRDLYLVTDAAHPHRFLRLGILH